MGGMAFHMAFVWGVVIALIIIVVAAVVYFARAAQSGSLLAADLAAARGASRLPTVGGSMVTAETAQFPVHDTIFILPDISNYTRFMTGSRFAFGHAQHIVFCLINAMVEAADPSVELSKLEGDAALFFVDADRHDSKAIGRTVADIFAAFFSERERLIRSNVCPCSSCAAIRELDLKIFVHRGEASRFSFRGSVDHFGTDVIILHRMMKNSVRGKRYVMITDAAAGSIDLPFDGETYKVEEDIENVGKIAASVHVIDDETAERLAGGHVAGKPSKVSETIAKLGENIRSLGRAAG